MNPATAVSILMSATIKPRSTLRPCKRRECVTSRSEQVPCCHPLGDGLACELPVSPVPIPLALGRAAGRRDSIPRAWVRRHVRQSVANRLLTFQAEDRGGRAQRFSSFPLRPSLFRQRVACGARGERRRGEPRESRKATAPLDWFADASAPILASAKCRSAKAFSGRGGSRQGCPGPATSWSVGGETRHSPFPLTCRARAAAGVRPARRQIYDGGCRAVAPAFRPCRVGEIDFGVNLMRGNRT